MWNKHGDHEEHGAVYTILAHIPDGQHHVRQYVVHVFTVKMHQGIIRFTTKKVNKENIR